MITIMRRVRWCDCVRNIAMAEHFRSIDRQQLKPNGVDQQLRELAGRVRRPSDELDHCWTRIVWTREVALDQKGLLKRPISEYISSGIRA